MLRGKTKGAFESHRRSYDRRRLKMSLSRHELHADRHELVTSFGNKKKKREKIPFLQLCGRDNHINKSVGTKVETNRSYKSASTSL